jgi:hypothetical protein
LYDCFCTLIERKYHDKQPDYEKKADLGLEKIEENTNLLREKLSAVRSGEDVAHNQSIQVRIVYDD